jgi:sodium transport system permease protein
MVFHVARKEILSTLRDRRAIVSNLLIPLLLLPAIMLGLPLALGGLFEREQSTVTEIGVHGAENLPDDLRTILTAQNVDLIATDSPEAAVRDDGFAAALSIPADFSERLAGGERADITIYSKQGNLRSELNASKIEAAVRVYRQQIVGERLVDAGLDPGILEPIVVANVDASSQAERSSGQLAWLIPFFIAIWTLTGGQMTAIDATAGEKERGTLEALLVAPLRRTEIVVGKFLATLTFGLSAAMMAIAGYVLGGVALRGIFLPRLGGDANEIVSIMGGALDANLGTVLLLFLSAVLLASLVAALLIAITLFARSFKEAQSYVAPLSFLLIVPGIGLQFKDLLDLGSTIYLVPVFNVLVLMDDIVKGTVQTSAILTTWAVLLITVALLLAFAYRNFRREGVIFRT